MDRSGFVKLTVIALVIVLASFIVLGFSRLVVSFQSAQMLSAPLGIIGFSLLVYLFIRAVLDATGLWRIERSDT